MVQPQNAPQAVPVQPGERIQFVDILRGFAVLGILIANMASFSGHSMNPAQTTNFLDRLVIGGIIFFVTAKFYSLFSFLFGWGMAIQMERAARKGIRFLPRFLRRLTTLLLFGITHAVLIWSGDILTLYALLGFLLLIFRKRSERILILTIALSLLLSVLLRLPGELAQSFRSWHNETLTGFLRSQSLSNQFYLSGTYLDITRLRLQDFLNGLANILFYAGNVFAMFLLGLLVGRRKIFQQISRHLPWMKKWIWAALLVGVSASAANTWMRFHPGWVPATWFPVAYSSVLQRIFYTIGAPSLMLFYVAGIIILSQHPTWYARLVTLAPVGRMALTNYLLQSIIGTLIFYPYGLGLYSQISPTVGLILTLLIFLAQVRFSEYWFERHNFGPFEWVWRRLTYSKLRLKASSEGETPQQSPSFSFLLAVWVLLALWASGLWLWERNQKAKAKPWVLPIVVEQNSQTAPSAPGITLPPDEGEPDQIRHLALLPVDRSPQQAARSGDVLSLTNGFDALQALEFIRALTRPEFAGRAAGSQGGKLAADYIANQFARYDLQPAGEQESFFQSFQVTFTPLEFSPEIKVYPPGEPEPTIFDPYNDFTPIVSGYSGSGDARGQAYWVAYCTQEDFAGLDLMGKVVLCQRNQDKEWLESASRFALEHGAGGLLILTEASQVAPDFRISFRETWVPQPLPTFQVYPRLVTEILTSSEMTYSDIIAAEEPIPLQTEVELHLHTRETNTCPGTNCTARNVLGVLPGHDPNFADEIVILGAHYDHMGASPGGLVWSGANDDASGVAALLEIARNWQAQGYTPRRTVVFAAWDAEELGLLGSNYYIENPTLPLQNTRAMLQLDMIGAGNDLLIIDGDTSLSNQIATLAATTGISTTLAGFGRSDHMPFLQASIPASMLIWDFESGDDTPTYHRPVDAPDSISTQKLDQVGRLAEETILNLVESEPAILDLLSEREAAMKALDRQAFKVTASSSQSPHSEDWFSRALALNPQDARFSVDALTINGSDAHANVTMEIDYIDPGTTVTQTWKARVPIAFEREANGWKWAGPALSNHQSFLLDDGSQISIAAPPEINENRDGFVSDISERYQAISHQLNLASDLNLLIELFPTAQALQASLGPAMPADTELWVTSGEIKIVYDPNLLASQKLQIALIQLVMANAGLEPQVAPWLWHGVPYVFLEQSDRLAIQSRFIPPLQETLLSGKVPTGSLAHWASAHYIFEELGWDGLAQLIRNTGQWCVEQGCPGQEVLDPFLMDLTGLDTTTLQAAWQTHWQERLTHAQNAIDQILASRQRAIQNDDLDAFLATVDPHNLSLRAEQASWFKHLKQAAGTTVQMDGKPLTLLPAGGLVVEITTLISSSAAGEESIHTQVAFSSVDTNIYWAGIPFQTLELGNVRLQYPAALNALADDLLKDAFRLYPLLAADLALPASELLEIKLYPDSESFRFSIAPGFPAIPLIDNWSGKGQSIKLRPIWGGEAKDYRSALPHAIATHLLASAGLEDGWLRQGLSRLIAQHYDDGAGLRLVSQAQNMLRTEIAEDFHFELTSIPPIGEQTEKAYLVNQALAWDAVNMLIIDSGWETISQMLPALDQGRPFPQAFQQIVGETPEDFASSWQKAIAKNHMRDEWLVLANDFDEQNAMRHVDALAAPEMAGRKAGTDGEHQAADYIAEQFSALGLIPWSESALRTLKLSGDASLAFTQPITTSTSPFLQTFPISISTQTKQPQIEVTMVSNQQHLLLIAGQDYLTTQLPYGKEHEISGNLVWAGGGDLTPENLAGNIVLVIPTDDLSPILKLAKNAGASAVIIGGNKKKPEERLSRNLQSNSQAIEADIPVFELTQSGFTQLLDLLGTDRVEIRKLSPGQSLYATLKISLPLNNLLSVESANVLGVLPGSDPYLFQEILVISAHYDFVGDGLDGLRYPGANDDASGIAAMLEIARLFQESGFQPKRSILFAAWGAQEPGNLGSGFFLEHSPFPLSSIHGVLQLDSIGGGEGFTLGVYGTMQDDGLLLNSALDAASALEQKIIASDDRGQSDHVTFHQGGIPAIMFSWRLAGDRNLPIGVAPNVRPERLAFSGRLIMLTLMALVH